MSANTPETDHPDLKLLRPRAIKKILLEPRRGSRRRKLKIKSKIIKSKRTRRLKANPKRQFSSVQPYREDHRDSYKLGYSKFSRKFL